MADLEDLLLRTSRTFALSIPRLPEPLRREVTLAYLLFRIADTFEDATHWPKERRLQALADFRRLLDTSGRGAGDDLLAEARRLAGSWTAGEPPIEHDGYLDLLAATPTVLEAHGALKPDGRAIVTRHTGRTAEGMAQFVERHDETGHLELRDLEELRRYCYVVAGIVGELLTDLFLRAEPDLGRFADPLHRRAARFGEALQLVNILKDSAADSRAGRRYLPADVAPATVFALARRDLAVAGEYVGLLQDGNAPPGVVAFTALPVELAWRTLARVEAEGPGAKLTRDEVGAAVEALEERLATGQPAVAADRGTAPPTTPELPTS